MRILDCSLREGGYLNNWDYDDRMCDTYICGISQLPVDIVGSGYRARPAAEFRGNCYYSPVFFLRKLREGLKGKKISLMVEELDTEPDQIEEMLGPVRELADIIRIGVEPGRIDKAVRLSEKVREQGFESWINLRRISRYREEDLGSIKTAAAHADTICLVDTNGALFPERTRDLVTMVRGSVSTPLAFHARNNIGLSFVNTLAAIEAGCTTVDCAFAGTGPEGGSLDSETLLTYIRSRGELDVDLDLLDDLSEHFRRHHGGNGIPTDRIISGFYDLSCNDISRARSRGIYSLNTLVDSFSGKEPADPVPYPDFSPSRPRPLKALIVGGGESVGKYGEAINAFVEKEAENMVIVHSSPRHRPVFRDGNCRHMVCLCGDSRKAPEPTPNTADDIWIVPPVEYDRATPVPETVSGKTYRLKEIGFTDRYQDTPLAVAAQAAIDAGATRILFVGFDGYLAGDHPMQQENQHILDRLAELIPDGTLFLTPTLYKEVTTRYIFTFPI